MLKKINNMKVKPKLIFCFVLVVCIASISGILGTVLLLNTDSSYSNALINNGFSQGEIGTFNTYLNKGSALVRDVIFLTDAEELQSAQTELEGITETLNQSLEKIQTDYKLTSEKDQEYISIIKEKLPQYDRLKDGVIELGLQNKNDEALHMFRDEARPVLSEVMAAAQGLAEESKTAGADASSALTAKSRLTVLVIAAVIVIAITISILFATYIAKSFAMPITLIQEASAKLARGELDIEVPYEGQDEIGDMAASFRDAVTMLGTYIADLSRGLQEISQGNFNIEPQVSYQGDFNALETAISTIIISLSATLQQISNASGQVAAGSHQMAESAQSLAEGATDQAGAIEELTATIENISQLVHTNAENANQAAADAIRFEQVASVSKTEMEQLALAMEQISVTSKKIETIIAEIEDIASQTNLLSLNASIEAARAGEAGKGFAVVADQIGQLASESAGSAVNTRELIENALTEIQKGNEITAKTMESLSKVIDGIRMLAKASNEISSMSNAQSEAMNQVQQGIEQISEVVQGNSAAAEETSATSEELSAQSESLNELVERFQLKA